MGNTTVTHNSGKETHLCGTIKINVSSNEGIKRVVDKIEPNSDYVIISGLASVGYPLP